MNSDKLQQIWKSQKKDPSLESPHNIIHKAKTQRNQQFLAIGIMSVTAVILILYAFYATGNQWNEFTLGLVLMISSLMFRIFLEFISLYRKENRLIASDTRSFHRYLKKHYKLRLQINFLITPICFVLYLIGFTRLLPYFKQEFSEGFYTYILISGFGSLFVIALIVVNSIRKESTFLKHLKQE